MINHIAFTAGYLTTCFAFGVGFAETLHGLIIAWVGYMVFLAGLSLIERIGKRRAWRKRNADLIIK